MGRLEKIVVLTVLFLVAVVLGVALNSDAPGASSGARGTQENPSNLASLPPGALSAGIEREAPAPAPEQAEPASSGAGPTLPEPTPPPAVSKPAELHPAAPKPAAPASTPYTVTRVGLVPSQSAELMFYTWQAGDTLAAVAQRYYGSKDKLARLQKANEGQSDANLQPGDQIWVPVEASPAESPAGSSGTVYLVKKGDVLSGISQQFYGTAKKWQKILDANTDVLSSPDKLQVGMKLRIPE